jgi:hypothetical protein
MRQTFASRAAPLAALCLLALAPAGCLVVQHGSSTSTSTHGPPPWAPAHGYRTKHPSGVDLVYDAGLGVYFVAQLPGVYFHGDRFYRQVNGGWGIAGGPGGPWLAVAERDIPPGLQRQQTRKPGTLMQPRGAR